MLYKVKERLMKDANKLYRCPSKYEEYARRIENAEYSPRCLDKEQFNNLVFMQTIVDLRINETFQTGAVGNRTYRGTQVSIYF